MISTKPSPLLSAAAVGQLEPTKIFCKCSIFFGTPFALTAIVISSPTIVTTASPDGVPATEVFTGDNVAR